MASDDGGGPVPTGPTNVHLKKPLDVVVHQCSACGYASVHRHNVVRHVTSRCTRATVLSDVIKMVQVGQTVDAAQAVMTLGNNNNIHTINQTIHNNNNTFNLVCVASEAERRAMEALLLQPSTQRQLADLPPHAVPGALLRLLKGPGGPDTSWCRTSGRKISRCPNGGM